MQDESGGEDQHLKFRPPSFIAHASAVVLGGQIDAVAQKGGNGEKKPLSPPIPIEGLSCAIAVNGGVVQAKRDRAETFVTGLPRPVISLVGAEATISSQVAGKMATTAVRTRSSSLEVNPQQEEQPVVFRGGAVELRSEGPAHRREPPTFSLQWGFVGEYKGALLEIEKLDLPSSYKELTQELEKPSSPLHGYVLPFSQFRPGVAATVGKPIALHLVRRLRWNGFEVVGNGTVPNGVSHPEIGHIYFAELLITERERRFSLMRFQFGSHIGGSGEGHGGGSNGEPGNY